MVILPVDLRALGRINPVRFLDELVFVASAATVPPAVTKSAVTKSAVDMTAPTTTGLSIGCRGK
jgi:hypothetical protein